MSDRAEPRTLFCEDGLLICLCNVLCREFLFGMPSHLVKATTSYTVENRLAIEQGDVIAVIDGRADLRFIKGQNQRTFDIGTFPR